MIAFQLAMEEEEVAINVPLALQIGKAALCFAESEWNLAETWL